MIIQGEGKGHFSQAMEAGTRLAECGTEIRRCYLGVSLFRRTPSYFKESCPYPLKTFLSPNFLRTPDRKGILVFLSLAVNFLLLPFYLFEVARLGWMLNRDRGNRILNFYDPLGGLAARWFRRGAKKITLSHHFYLSHPDFIHPHGLEGSYFWLQLMNRFMLKQSDRALALSFRHGARHGKIEVIPPLVDSHVRNIQHKKGKSDLCYFLNEGFAREVIDLYRAEPGRVADVFSDLAGSGDVPANVTLHAPSRELFPEKMKRCRRIITTAGFDTVAEAMYLGVAVFVLPAVNHYEQYCNALDASRTGMAFQVGSAGEGLRAEFEPVNNEKFRERVNSFDFCRTIWLS